MVKFFSSYAPPSQSLQGRQGNAAVDSPVCLLTVGNTSSITQPTQSGADPVWDQCFNFPASCCRERRIRVVQLGADFYECRPMC